MTTLEAKWFSDHHRASVDCGEVAGYPIMGEINAHPTKWEVDIQVNGRTYLRISTKLWDHASHPTSVTESRAEALKALESIINGIVRPKFEAQQRALEASRGLSRPAPGLFGRLSKST